MASIGPLLVPGVKVGFSGQATKRMTRPCVASRASVSLRVRRDVITLLWRYRWATKTPAAVRDRARERLRVLSGLDPCTIGRMALSAQGATS